jgi:cytoskeletal protein RodZ
MISSLKNLDKDKSKEMIKTGSILILVAGLVAFIVLINFYYTDKLQQLQSMSASNMQRLTNIENFLNQQIQASQAQNSTTPSSEQK